MIENIHLKKNIEDWMVETENITLLILFFFNRRGLNNIFRRKCKNTCLLFLSRLR